MTVLVAYASRHGATAGIAARIAGRLADSGAAVDLRRVDEVEWVDGYDAVVLGAPVYDQSWPPEFERFVAVNREALAARQPWLFSVGSFGDTKRLIGPLTHKEPRGVDEIRAGIRAREYRVFQGVIRRHQWPLWSRLFFHAFGGRFGDHRDWLTIDAWADRLGPEVRTCLVASDLVAGQGHPDGDGGQRNEPGERGHREDACDADPEAVVLAYEAGIVRPGAQ